MAKVLVCDDDKEIVEAIDIYLTQEGYEVFKAYDGQEALEVLKKESVDLLVIDVMMPRLDGIRATLKIREENILPRGAASDCALLLVEKVSGSRHGVSGNAGWEW